MVGAGFSRNAENGHLLKTWPELSEELAKRLEPNRSSVNHSVSEVTQLGEQFARVFSVPDLEDLLKRNIPDESVSPGDLHDQLLRLPWSEIFTTNYDTLLERAADKIFESSHFTVCSREDIPLPKILGRRRIVKLHGSFPSQRPFIFTEEDYRTYPEKFSPFINLVRQSLIENVFCLIGFSGDDPNFLNWIGWVRDVLEKHANSVYLLLSKEPSYGNRKLLEARGVTPVVIPEASGGRENNYYNRYHKLFEAFREPTESNPLEWGEIKWTEQERQYLESKKERADRFIKSLEKISKAKEAYPKWIVSPTSVRKRFRASMNSIPEGFSDKEVLSQIKEKPSEVAVAIFSLYAWVQKVLLEPMDDNVAMSALSALNDSKDKRRDGALLYASKTLEKLGVNDRNSFKECWEELAKELLHWSRQSLRTTEISVILRVIEEAGFPSSELSDQIIHEKMLRHLYQGEVDQASRLVREWQPSSSDPFFLVLKSSVLAEVGDPKQAIDLCNTAIQKLRKMQRSNPEDNILLSKEAWACFLCHNIQKSVNLLSRFGQVESGADSDTLIEDLDRRLTALSQHGYDCNLILTEVLSDLNSEASITSGDSFVSHSFDVGSVSTSRQIGSPVEQVRKVTAAFQWLELTERVGLVPRVGNTTFYIDSYLQAAWWSQYSDTAERMLSILIRTKNANAIKPNDHKSPQYKTGWLSREQVARIPTKLCSEICDRLLCQVEQSANKQESKRLTELSGFYLEVFSRLAVRLSNADEAHGFIARLVKLHCSPMVTNNISHELWKSLASALSRTIESLPEDEQLKTVNEVVKVPLVPSVKVNPPFDEDWLNPAALSYSVKRDNFKEIEPQIISDIEKLVEVISSPKSDHHNDPLLIRRAWHRIYWLMNLGFLTEEFREKISNVLWKDETSWPVAPGFYPHATFNWIPSKIEQPELLFKEFCLSRKISGFLTPSAMQEKLKARDYLWGFPTNDQTFILWIESLKKAGWGQEDAVFAMKEVQKWWDDEGDKIKADISRSSNLQESFMCRTNYIDLILCFLFNSEKVDNDFVLRVADRFIKTMPEEYAPFWRMKIIMTHACQSLEHYSYIKEDILTSIMSGERVKGSVASSSLLDSIALLPEEEFSMYANAASSMLVSESFPNILSGLKLIAQFLKKSKFPLSEYQVFMVRAGLAGLRDKLSYQRNSSEVGIPDPAIPLLRYYCILVAYLMSFVIDESLSDTVFNNWLNEAESDPLPEIKYKRYIYEAKV